MQLRLTRRALDDLGLSVEEHARLPATDFPDAHEMVRAFVERRSQSPVSQEATVLPVTKAPVYNIHQGRYRGLTWHDRESDVIWLLGVGWHESGSTEDVYAILKARDTAAELMPTADDYLDLEMTFEEARSFARRIADEAPDLVQRAFSAPGTEVRGILAGRLNVGVHVEVVTEDGESVQEVSVAFEMPPTTGACELPPQAEWIMTVMEAMIPVEISCSDLEYGRPFPRLGGSRPNEIVVCWCSR